MEQRVRFTERELATNWLYPLTTTLLTATTEGAAETLATFREDTTGIVKRLVVGNQTASAADVTLHFIPSGGAIGASNREIAALEIPGNSNVDLTDLVAGLYAGGTEVKAFASAGNALIVMGYIEGLL